MQLHKLCILGICFLSSSIFAEPMPVVTTMVLDNVQFQLSARDWVSTDSALLKLHVSVTLSHSDIVKARQHILEKLYQVAKGDWQITQFNQGQDSSGLEKLEVDTQVRVAQNSLTNVYQQVKNISQPGENYSVSAVEFKPSFEEIQQAKSNLRDKLYQKVLHEVESLNKFYPEQHYSIHHLEFIEDNPVMMPKMQNEQLMLASTPSMPMKTQNELNLTVIVDLASHRLEK